MNINKDFNNEFSSIKLLFIERQITTVPSKRLILEGKDPSEKIQQSTITYEEALGKREKLPLAEVGGEGKKRRNGIKCKQWEKEEKKL